MSFDPADEAVGAAYESVANAFAELTAALQYSSSLDAPRVSEMLHGFHIELRHALTGREVVMSHFKAEEMLHALSLTVTSGGMLWSVRNEVPAQYLSWSAEEAIAFIVGKMFDPAVRKEITENATVEEPVRKRFIDEMQNLDCMTRKLADPCGGN